MYVSPADRISTLEAVVAERRRDLARSEARLAGASGAQISVWQASVDLDRTILATVEAQLAEARTALVKVPSSSTPDPRGLAVAERMFQAAATIVEDPDAYEPDEDGQDAMVFSALFQLAAFYAARTGQTPAEVLDALGENFDVVAR